MATIEISPQEMAAQMLGAFPYYGDDSMPEAHANHLDDQAKVIKAELEELRPYTLTDEELASKLADVKARATESGVWEPHKGEGADERLAYAIERKKEWGCDDKEAVIQGLKSLKQNGYLEAMRDRRKEQEQLFKEPIAEFINDNELDPGTESTEIAALLEHTIDIATLKPAERARLSNDFPSGNFVYHGTGTEQLVKILRSGEIVNAKALYDREERAAEVEKRDEGIVQHNSGYEGVSWSMNGIDALPGDRYHLAGFIAAPESILSDRQQLAVPSRPSPNEVLQISSEINASSFYDAKNQFELYYNIGTFGESNSAFDNLLSIGLWEEPASRKQREEPLLFQAQRGVLSEPEYQKYLRKLYSVGSDGAIRLSADLLQQVDNQVPVAAVWLQAAIDTGRLRGTPFEGKDVTSIISSLDGESAKAVIRMMQKDWQPYKEMVVKGERAADNVVVPVENMWFVAPRKDAEQWLRVIVRCGHKPAGILLYDDRKVRLENFASLHRGDHTELTNELQTAIVPQEGYIDYSQVLGAEFSDDMRAGHAHQVIAERHLGNRKPVRKVNGKLVVG